MANWRFPLYPLYQRVISSAITFFTSNMLSSVLKTCQEQAPPLYLRHDTAPEASIQLTGKVDE